MTRTLADHCRECRFGPEVTARVLRLNADPPPEGVKLRGVHRKPTLWRQRLWGGVGRADYEARWGMGTWRRIPKRFRLRYTGRLWCVGERSFRQGVHGHG